MGTYNIIMSLVMRKPVLKVSDQGLTQTDDGKRLEILDLGSRGYFLCSENKGADLVRDFCAPDLRLLFFAYAKSRFSHDVAYVF